MSKPEIPSAQSALAEVVSAPYTPAPSTRLLPRLSRKRLVVALIIAVASDFFSVGVEFLPPVQLLVDLITAVLLFMVLGWQWLLLPALVAEAIPGISIFPVWTLVVLSIAVAGNVRR